MAAQASVQYTGFINSFELHQRPLSHEKIAAKIRASRASGISFGGPQMEPDPDMVRVSFTVDDLNSFGEIPITRAVVKKLRISIEDRVKIMIAPEDNPSNPFQGDAAEFHGTINVIAADPASPMVRTRALANLKRMRPFLIPDIDPGVTYEATEQREFELASEMVRLEISDNSRQSHANVPIRKIDLASLDLLTGDSVMVGIKKTA